MSGPGLAVTDGWIRCDPPSRERDAARRRGWRRWAEAPVAPPPAVADLGAGRRRSMGWASRNHWLNTCSCIVLSY